MQSSPPVRTWERPTSPTDSQYSIDLGALDVESTDLSPLPKQKIERVLSEDIDGPSDFTINMEKWMRGGTLSNGTMRSVKGALASLKEQDDPSLPDAPGGAQGPPPLAREEEALLHEEPTGSHHTPSNSPPRESVRSDHSQRETGEHASSDWDPYGEASTPQPPVHRQFLQPTVEEYHSELTPARGPSVQASLPRGRSLHRPANKLPFEAQSEPSSPGRASSPTLSPVRSPGIQRSTQSTANQGVHLERELQRLEAKCQQLEHLNSALKQALDEEQRIRRREKEAHEAQTAYSAKREHDLTETKEEACQRAEGFRAEFGERQERLRMLELNAGRHGDEIAALNDRHVAEVQKVKADMERQRLELEQKLRLADAQLDQARRCRDDAEEASRVHRDELDEYRDTHDAELERMRLELETVEDDKTRVIELQNQLKSGDAERVKLVSAEQTALEAAAAAQTELSQIRTKNNGDTTQNANNDRRAHDLAVTLQQKLEELQHQLQDQQTAHIEEIARLEATQRKALESAKINEDVESNQSLLNDAILERDAAQDGLAALQAEVETMRTRLEDSEAVNEMFDARISDAMRKRETYWRTRVEKSEQERQVMAKALLHQWGREERGVGLPQAYEYKYVDSKLRSKGFA